jgi:hypothetical protein
MVRNAPMAAVDVSGSIITNTTWSAPVYHVTGPTYVLPDVTLTIDPGTVVKLGHWDDWRAPTQLSVDGTLYAVGTEAEPVVFTSYWDDDHGGDTNGDGSATTAEPGDWYAIYFGGRSTGRIRHAWIGYGGSAPPRRQGMVTVKSDQYGAADVLLEHVTLTEAYASNGAIFAIKNDLTVRHSQLLVGVRDGSECPRQPSGRGRRARRVRTVLSLGRGPEHLRKAPRHLPSHWA